MKRALITGVSGQDGSLLAELLVGKGYEVHGLIRRSASGNLSRLTEVRDRLELHEGDLTDEGSLARVVADVRPDEVYNLAAQSHVGSSFAAPIATCDATGLGAVRLLEAVRHAGLTETRYYQAGTSELFGGVSDPPQSEVTPLHPRSPYAYAKAMAHYATINAREAYGLFACNGILFNHEEPGRRGEAFVTRKISRAVARIKLGLQESLTLGNLEAKRDWGRAKDYIEAMWLMLQQDKPRDYVIATGETHSVREFVDVAFAHVGLRWDKHVTTDTAFNRPSEVHVLCGDASKAARELGWRPKTAFAELVALMVDADLALAGG
ncbi:MAG TPA: GDP-mannose 4,6-dehydratase [Gemmatimonadaceae bacterium]|jgi:GDPmannose 4,6-dehydratase|nr:GDP-mannose 4,6-dehydratase [Gemmatimonadaceae bacterium]